MTLRHVFDAEALCILCDQPMSRRALWRDDENGFEEWGEWEAVGHDDQACYKRLNGVGRTVLREARR